MNPDKLFDYLDGRLPAAERAALEEQLISDGQLQRELAVARRVGAAFIILMAVNVGIGLWLIARHESKDPNRSRLEAQTRQQITRSLEQAARAALTPLPSLGVSEITISAAPGRLETVADE